LIGVVCPDDSYSSVEQVEADRRKWPELVERENGTPIFDLLRAAQWMAEISGQPVTKCRHALEAEWPC
jgi:hypothetical protein